ncbi:DUF3274 domain-containing protein [Pantoea sp. SO10]|uniref:T6SS effector phospholipase Tle3 domain-containing protein n=1 Tax=Pantoea sp. SO10 TaxID=2575375 RepID=UPI001FEE6FAF|nr:DUF3274 domain-containing protein [Pantoea sp. SO10]
MKNNNDPLRSLETVLDDNGQPSWRSFPSHKNIQVRGACDLPPHLPGLVIFVHGVNSTGEWYQLAERHLCKGLNQRLGLDGTDYKLSENIYDTDGVIKTDSRGRESVKQNWPLKKRETGPKIMGNSPIIRFYWGYASPVGEEDKYVIPLANIEGYDYYQMKREGKTADEIKSKGPYIWGGGPFQNGTNNLHSLWSDKGFNEDFAGIYGAKVQYVNADIDRLLSNAPSKKYYAHAAKRLADLLNMIRKKYPKDTVSIISHSQGTMISLAAAALADKGPDALFILNSPYAMDNNIMSIVSSPADERITPKGRESTLSAIVEKVALQATHLSSQGYEGLCVGQTSEKKNWRPDSTIAVSTHDGGMIPERDNHGRTWIYFCPHDRVMGSAPLRSVGWQGLPNDKNNSPHPLLIRHKGKLFQRMLARNTGCGESPDQKAPFGRLSDGKSFWDDKGDKYASSSIAYPDPPIDQTVFINGEKVPEPIKANELDDFDDTRVGLEHTSEQKDGWGEINPKTGAKNDNTYDNFIGLYPDQDVIINVEYVTSGFVRTQIKETRKETFEEKDARLRTYVSQPTDHSTLPSSDIFMRRIVAYDLPVGYCDASWDKAFMSDLRRFADWTQGGDSYINTGIPDDVIEPAEISRESIPQPRNGYRDAFQAAQIVDGKS